MFRMTVEDVFFISGRGVVVTGRVDQGTVRVGDRVLLNGGRALQVTGIEAFRRVLEQASSGENVGVLLAGLDRKDIKRGDVLSADDDASGLPDSPPQDGAATSPDPFGRTGPPADPFGAS